MSHHTRHPITLVSHHKKVSYNRGAQSDRRPITLDIPSQRYPIKKLSNHTDISSKNVLSSHRKSSHHVKCPMTQTIQYVSDEGYILLLVASLQASARPCDSACSARVQASSGVKPTSVVPTNPTPSAFCRTRRAISWWGVYTYCPARDVRS